MTDTAHLRDLLSKATPGPWFDCYSAIHSEPITREHQRLEMALGDDAPDEAYDALPDARLAFFPVQGGDTPTQQAAHDQALIVAAVNALPALLDQLEAARRVVAAAKEWRATFPPAPMEPRGSLLDHQLIRAVDALDAAGKDGATCPR